MRSHCWLKGHDSVISVCKFQFFIKLCNVLITCRLSAQGSLNLCYCLENKKCQRIFLVKLYRNSGKFAKWVEGVPFSPPPRQLSAHVKVQLGEWVRKKNHYLLFWFFIHLFGLQVNESVSTEVKYDLDFCSKQSFTYRNNSCGIKHCIGASYQRQHLSSYFPFPKRTFSLGCLQINYLAIQSNAFLSLCLGLVWQAREPSSNKQVRLLCSKFLFRRVKCRR